MKIDIAAEAEDNARVVCDEEAIESSLKEMAADRRSAVEFAETPTHPPTVKGLDR